MDVEHSSSTEGKLLIAYSDKSGSTVGLEFTSVASEQATFLMGACTVAASGKHKRIVTSTPMSNTHSIESNTGSGGNDMEKRIAVLEADVAHIKGDVSEIKSSVSSLNATVISLDKNMAVALEKLSGIKDSIDKKPSTDAVEKRIAEAKLAILLGVPAIIGVGTAIYKVIAHFLAA